MEGLLPKYRITKADGSAIDPNAKYFVLRYDASQKDIDHGAACRQALLTFARNIEDVNSVLAADLRNEVHSEL